MRIRKPIVRGEAGLDSPDEQSETVLALDRDSTGVWLHNFLWAGLDSGALHELYWWNSHVWANPAGIIRAYRAVSRFLRDVPLNKGGYVDWGGTVTNPSLRVVGQKNTATGSLHLWVQNRAHTWKNVVKGVVIPPISGSIVVPGFTPGTTYALERWDTYVFGGRVASIEHVVGDSTGRLTIRVTALSTDVAFKIQPGHTNVPRVQTGETVTSQEQAAVPVAQAVATADGLSRTASRNARMPVWCAKGSAREDDGRLQRPATHGRFTPDSRF
jgi:hypothetical protein